MKSAKEKVLKNVKISIKESVKESMKENEPDNLVVSPWKCYIMLVFAKGECL